MTIDFETVVPAFDAILARGLSNGLGKRNGQMCVEAAICAAMGLPHGDNPQCVAKSVRQFKIALNDRQWSSAVARADGLRRLGIAQLGSLGVVNDRAFTAKLAESLIRVLVPTLFREVLGADSACMAAADACEHDGTQASSRKAYAAAYAANAAYAAYAAARSPGALWLLEQEARA